MMNIHNSENGFAELSLNDQSEMQLCKLNESESRPNLTLKKIGQELDIAETKCFTLKSELNYMMGVCRKAQTEIKENRTLSNISPEQIASLSENPVSKSPVEYRNHKNEITAVDETLNCKSFRKIHNNEQKTEENFEITHLSPKSAQFSLKKITSDNDISKKLENTNLQEEQSRLLNNYSVTVKVTPRFQLDKTFPPAITIPVQDKEMLMEEERNVQSCYPEQMRKYFQSMLNVKESVEKLSPKGKISEGDENYICVLPSLAREDIRNLELNLNMFNDTEVKSTGRNTHTWRMNDRKKNSKANDTVSKTRKRKRKLRSSVSKSTVTTKNTNLLSGKETRKLKPKGHNVSLHQSILPKISKRSSDILEIFHNTTMKSSNSVISNQHSKLDRQTKCIKRQRISDVNNKRILETSDLEPVNYEYQSHNKENQQAPYSELLHYPNDSGMIPIQEHCNTEECSDPSCASLPHKIDKYEHTVFSKYNDPIFIPNYEMPTLASKLKRANRSYFSRFNIRNIPFIVGTSVTPSHNLGLNIQQVLSIMKSRQISSDITPLLMSKISRGIKPVSLLLEQYEKSFCQMNSRTIKVSNSKEYLNINQGNKRLSILRLGQRMETPQSVHNMYPGNVKKISEKNNITKHVYKEGDDVYKNYNSNEQETVSSSVANKTNIPETVKEEISTISLNQKNLMGDHKNQPAIAHNSKEIRNVFVNLHNQFEEMYTKYEKMQSEIEKSNDKSLMKELSIMEKELNIKEEEINAVISLYKEVIMLKRQMKLLNEKNSLVCIATKSATESYKNTLPISFISGKSRSMNSTQAFSQRWGSIYNTTREPPTSIQLTALLRQIQTFHKQLQLVS